VLWLAQRRAMSLIAGISSGWPGERPFWETEDDLDDESLPEAPWYEQISDWIITAFLAVTFTPDAAIVYNSTIPRMRLVFRSGDLGATVRVLIDGVEALYESLYSETPEIVERIVEAVPTEGFRLLGTEPPYVLRIEKADSDPETKLEVVLGDIRPEDGSEVQFRQLEHCPLEFSSDGGETWTQIYSAADCVVDGINEAIANDTIATPADIAALGRAMPPDTTQPSYGYLCAGIKAVIAKCEEYLDAILADIDAAKESMAIASDIAAITVAGDVIVDDILALIADSTALTTAAIRAAKGANGLDELYKALYCLARSAGGFFEETFTAWRNQDVGGNIWKAAMIDASKIVSWMEWATVYAVAATNEDNSCEAGYDCGWCYLFDFTVDNGGWAAYGDPAQATYVAGSYWSSVDIVLGVQRRICQIIKTFDATDITYLKMVYDRTGGGTQYNAVAGVAIGGTSVPMDECTDGNDLIVEWSGSGSVTIIYADVQSSHGEYAGIARIKSIEVHGLGDCPFGTPNCE
jgi:hypothetical protein